MTIDIYSPCLRDPPDPTEAVFAPFRRGAMLVELAATALATIETLPARMESEPAAALRSLDLAIESASVDGDNLLGPPHAKARPLVVFALARQASGALRVNPIEIDRATTTMDPVRAEMAGLVALRRPDRDTIDAAVGQARTRIAAVASRLSIVKTRLDLQSTFLTAIRDADSSAQVVRLDEHLNHQGARDMALATRRLLGRQSLNIANTNKKTLESLFERHVADPRR